MKSKSNYLKYWRPIKYYIKVKYKLSDSNLELLLFLYSEGRFSSAKFLEYDKIMSWEKKRLDNFVKDGWIDVFRQGKGRSRTIFQVSHKTEKMCTMIYNLLEGKDIEFKTVDGRAYKPQVSFTDKFYQNMLMKMKEDISRKKSDPYFEIL